MADLKYVLSELKALKEAHHVLSRKFAVLDFEKTMCEKKIVELEKSNESLKHQVQKLEHTLNEKEEEKQNFLHKDMILLFTDSDGMPKDRMDKALSETLQKNDVSQFTKLVGNVSSFSQRDEHKNIVRIKLKKGRKRTFVKLVKENKTAFQNSKYSFNSSLTKQTRVKKDILGHIQNRLNQEHPKTACVPKHETTAGLYVADFQSAETFGGTTVPKRLSYYDAIQLYYDRIPPEVKQKAYADLLSTPAVKPDDAKTILLF